MGIIITKQEVIDEYFEKGDMSQSLIKKLLGGMDSFLESKDDTKKLYYEEKGHFIIGSAVDLLLTGEQDEFDKQYYISDLENKPSDTEMSMINMVFDDMIDSYSPVQVAEEGFEYGVLAQYPGSIQKAIEEEGWYKGNPGEKRTQGFIERGMDYFEDLKKAHGKQVISVEQNITITEVVESFRTNRRTKHFFDRVAQGQAPTVDIFYQLPIYFTYKGISCKALLDMVFVFKDENNKVLFVEPFDVKTMHGNTVTFLQTGLRVRRYDIQAAWYKLAVYQWMLQMGFDRDAKILPFKFIVESTSQPGTPLIYVCSDELIEIGANGRQRFSTINTEFFGDSATVVKEEVILKAELKGYNQLIDEYHWYQTNGWIEEKAVTENDGVLTINWNGII